MRAAAFSDVVTTDSGAVAVIAKSARGGAGGVVGAVAHVRSVNFSIAGRQPIGCRSVATKPAISFRVSLYPDFTGNRPMVTACTGGEPRSCPGGYRRRMVVNCRHGVPKSDDSRPRRGASREA